MKIATNCVVSIHYTLTDDDGNTIDSSIGDEPLNYLQGASNIIPGLERELEGAEVGQKLKVTVQPKDGYGEIEESLIQVLPKEAFDGVENLEVGMALQAEGESGNIINVVVTEVKDKEVTIDGNPELAGLVLHFDVTVEAIREATAEEIDHGHVH